MAATATPTKPEARDEKPRAIPDQVRTMHDSMVADARRRWREWCTAIAEGRELPVQPQEVLEAAAVLGERDPGVALSRDSEIVREAIHAEQRAQVLKAAAGRTTEGYGGMAGVRARITELTAELRKLKSLSQIHPALYEAGRLLGDADRIRRAHPHLFPAVPTKPTKPKPAKSSRRSAK